MHTHVGLETYRIHCCFPNKSKWGLCQLLDCRTSPFFATHDLSLQVQLDSSSAPRELPHPRPQPLPAQHINAEVNV